MARMKYGIYSSTRLEDGVCPFAWTTRGSYMLPDRDYEELNLFQPNDYLVAPKELAQWTK